MTHIPHSSRSSSSSRSHARSRKSSALPARTARHSPLRVASAKQGLLIGFVVVGGLAAARQIYSSPQSAPLKPKLAARPTPVATPKKDKLPGTSTIPAWAQGKNIHHGYTREKVIALTFDDGPFPTYTRQVLEILKKNQIRATFFMIGKMVRAYPKIAVSVRDEGHVIANHSWSHNSRPAAPVAEVQKTTAILKSTLGQNAMAPLFRPPYGMLRNGMAAAAAKDKLSVIIWNSSGDDWSRNASASSIISHAMRNATPGGIILLHDGGGHRRATVKALPTLIARLRGQGYRFVTVPELLAMSKKPSDKPRLSKTKARKKRANPKNMPHKTAKLTQPVETQGPVAKKSAGQH